jgi:hypothetical protein
MKPWSTPPPSSLARPIELELWFAQKRWVSLTATPQGPAAPRTKLGATSVPSRAARPSVVPLPSPPRFAQYTYASALPAPSSVTASVTVTSSERKAIEPSARAYLMTPTHRARSRKAQSVVGFPWS